MSGNEDIDNLGRRDYKQPHSARHPIPTVQQYRTDKERQRADLGLVDENDPSEHNTRQSYIQATKDYWNGPSKHAENKQDKPPPSPSPDAAREPNRDRSDGHEEIPNIASQKQPGDGDDNDETKDTSQVAGPSDPKAKRKQMKNSKAQAEREVTDPVTHLPVNIRDFTDEDMEKVETPSPQTPARTDSMPGMQEQGRSMSSLDKMHVAQREEHASMRSRFPPPNYDDAMVELRSIYALGISIGLGALFVLVLPLLGASLLIPPFYTRGDREVGRPVLIVAVGLLSVAIAVLIILGVQSWMKKQAHDVWEDSVWFAQHQESKDKLNEHQQETTRWLSKIIGSIWPLVNPDLFISVSDTLEDVMQASLPRLVRMVSVEDIGQGSEPFRILGVTWLPKAAAGSSVKNDGSLRDNDKDPNHTQSQDNDEVDKSDERQPDSGNATQEGMTAEEGEFMNIEMAVAYRSTRYSKRKMKHRPTQNAHLLLAFYLPGNIKLPIWVELQGFIASIRARMELTPDPPFIALSTFSIMGQPKVSVRCVPLSSKARGLNIMDLPLISNFVQSAINAALSEYVAPKSISLDLQAMISGDDFKKDTEAKGVLVVRIKRAFDFKAGDPGIPLIGDGDSSDAYVSVGWAKFGKPLWSTRVIVKEMHPYWEEETYLLVGPQELNAQESLRLQLWDSDKFTADDDLGRIELPLRAIMRSEDTNGKMCQRVDGFKALEAGDEMPGRCEWSLGYFSKTRLLEHQMKQQEQDRDIKSVADLKKKVYAEAGRKVRQAARNETSEVEQLKHADWQKTEVDMISQSLPAEEYPSGILSIHCHQIVGLKVEDVRKTGVDDSDEIDEANAKYPDSYCTFSLNHQKVYRTRVKPKSTEPFYNAATERFIRDWRTTTLILTVRDSRVHEDDPLLGLVHIDLGRAFRQRKAAQFNDYFPLAGGMGFGRLRLSVAFRSIQLQAPQTALGWEWGTLEIGQDVVATDNLPSELRHHRLKFKTSLGKGRMFTSRHDDATQVNEDAVAKWNTNHNHALLLPVQKRYASNLTIEFRSTSGGLLKNKKTLAFSVLWLQNIPDEEWVTVTVPVFTGDFKRATANVLPEAESGEKVGELRVRLRLWRGIGAAHRGLAKKDRELFGMMEALDAGHDLGELPAMVGAKGWRKERDIDGRNAAVNDDDGEAEDESSDSDDDDDDDDNDDKKNKENDAKQHQSHESATAELRNMGKPTDTDSMTTTDTGAEGDSIMTTDSGTKHKGGLLSDAKDYLQKRDSLHRRHRGIMQWKGPRTLQWAKHKGEGVVDRLQDKLTTHHGREPDLETEV